jgi:hypothetical protein
MYNILGNPKTDIAHGRGFGNQIPHLVLTQEAKAAFRFFYKIAGMQMEWKEFTPVFFQDNPEADPKDLALLCTFGWKHQAALSDDGMGFIHKGYKRYVVSGKAVAEGCVKDLW